MIEAGYGDLGAFNVEVRRLLMSGAAGAGLARSATAPAGKPMGAGLKRSVTA